MSCTNPLKAWTIGINSKTGKNKIKVTGRDVQYLEKVNHSWIKRYDDLGDNFVSRPDIISEFDYIPCGKCLSCRLAYAKDWTIRCMAESTMHEDNYFITLTYDDYSLPFNVDVGSGEFSGKSTLVKKHLQDFFKRLRKNYSYDNHLKYYACGEYGSLSLRPHYHTIIFGLKLDDLTLYKKSALGYPLYTSDFLNRCWKFGYVIVAPVTWLSASYVARYVMKKQGIADKDIYDDHLIQPEFTTMSLKPAIGAEYYEEHKDSIYKFDALYLPEGKVVKPPKYFDTLFERDFPDRFEVLKENRKKCQEIQLESSLKATNYDFDDFLVVQDKYLQERTKSLLRKEI